MLTIKVNLCIFYTVHPNNYIGNSNMYNMDTLNKN